MSTLILDETKNDGYTGLDAVVLAGDIANNGTKYQLDLAKNYLDEIIPEGTELVITTGNHVFRRREIYQMLDDMPALLRPANYPASAPGSGWYVVDKGRFRVAVANLLGTVYLEPLASPFDTADALLAQSDVPTVCVLDLHAEATSEKRALAEYLDGRVSLVFGTHTHVQTADEQILPHGTGFITDVGMTGPTDSVLGVCKQQAIQKMREHMPVRFTAAEGRCRICGIVADIDEKTGKTRSIARIAVD